MKKVLDDAINGITWLSNLTYVDNKRIGTLGHFYGGNTVLFLSALDDRIAFSCASGSACTYEKRIINNVGSEMASVIQMRKFEHNGSMNDMGGLSEQAAFGINPVSVKAYSSPGHVQGMCLADGKLYVMFECASNQYLLGNLISAKWELRDRSF